MKQNPKKFYAEQMSSCQQEISREKKKLTQLSFLRFLFFVAGGALCFYLFSVSVLLAVFSILLLMASFGRMVIVYQKHVRKIAFLENLLKVNEQESQVLEGEFHFFNDGKEYIDSSHPFSFDLDVFGIKSIYQFLNRAKTFLGKRKLADWLKNPLYDVSEIKERQNAINELSGGVLFRQKMMALGMSVEESKKNLNDVLAWVEKEPVFYGKRKYLLQAVLIPLFMFAALGLYIAGLLSYLQFLLAATLPLILTFQNMKKINALHSKVGKTYEMLMKYSGLIETVGKKDFESEYLKKLKKILNDESGSASDQIKRFASSLKYLDNRYNVIIAILGNLFLMWDLNTILYAEKQKQKLSSAFKSWLNVLAELEVLSSLANLQFNNPDYVFPTPLENENVFVLKNAGHPLIPKDQSVNNSCELTKQGQFMIITGPNMAGKSTYLRMVGVNYLLAMVGSVVCAESFEFSCKQLYTSMRTSDSLQNNESYFYAELKRLKNLVDELREGKKRFVILDEILKGTNSKDKQEGSKLFLRQISELNGQGLVATHDLNLGDLETENPEKFVNKSFEMEIKNDELLFDYSLKSGLTSKMNASYLMKKMGIIQV